MRHRSARQRWRTTATSLLCALSSVALALILILLPSERVAYAQSHPSIPFLVDRLKASDFKVRTNAALALGAIEGEDSALTVEPLCGAISDQSDVVRQAAAAALKRVGRSEALSCLKNQLASETSDPVRLQLTRAVEAIEGAANAPTNGPPRENPNAKFYISLSPISNSSGRVQSEVEAIVVKAIREKLDAAGQFQLAPTKESPAEAKAVMAKRKLKGFYLSITVDKFAYFDGKLKVTLRMAVFTYPGKDLRGQVPKSLTQDGVVMQGGQGDRGAEDNLLGMAAQFASDDFIQNATNFL